MLQKKISEQILTVGCSYKHPKGGVAQVMKNYEEFIFSCFKCVVNSGGKSKFVKLFKTVFGWLEMLFRLLFDRQIKIVHIHTASYNSFKRSALFLKLANFFGKKTILHIHGGGFKEYYATNPKWISRILNSCDVIITLSESWKEYYQSITKVSKVFIVENIIAYPNYMKYEKTGKCNLLFLGKIGQLKGIYDLLEVLYQHKEYFSDKIVLHIGGNGEIGKLKEKIAEYKLNDIVIYEGFVSGTKKDWLLSNCDAYILPSYTEGLPVSILEAMSYGKPILSTQVGGIPEVVKENGILFHPGDKTAIFNAINFIAGNEILRGQMGLKSKKIIDHYLPANIEAKLNKIYTNILK